MENDLDQQIKHNIKQLRKELLADGRSEKEIQKIVFQKLGNKYGPEFVESKMLDLLENDDEYLESFKTNKLNKPRFALRITLILELVIWLLIGAVVFYFVNKG